MVWLLCPLLDNDTFPQGLRMAATAVSIPLYIRAPWRKGCNESKSWLSPFPGRKSPPRVPMVFSLCFIGWNWITCSLLGQSLVKGKQATMTGWRSVIMPALRLGALLLAIREEGGYMPTCMSEAYPSSSPWRWLWLKTEVCPLSPLIESETDGRIITLFTLLAFR